MTATDIQFARQLGFGFARLFQVSSNVHAPLYANRVPASTGKYANPGTPTRARRAKMLRMSKKQYPKPRHYLREWRQFRKMTLEDLAKEAGTTKGVISEIELSKKGLSLKWLYRLAPALKTSPGMIVDYHPEIVDHDALSAFLRLGEAEKQQVLKIIGVLQKRVS